MFRSPYVIPGIPKYSRLTLSHNRVALIIKEVLLKFYNTDESSFMYSQDRHMAEGRHIYMYLISILTGLKHKDIAIYTDNDRTTVVYAVKKIKGIMSVDHMFYDELSQITKKINLSMTEYKKTLMPEENKFVSN